MNKLIFWSEGVISVIFLFSILLFFINRDLLKSLPEIFVNSFFWFTFGLYLGFQIFKYGIKLYSKKHVYTKNGNNKNKSLN